MRNWIAIDIETIGELPEYALQASRCDNGATRIRAVSYAWVDENGKLQTRSELDPTIHQMQFMFDRFKSRTWIAWNACFDISWFQSAGLDVVNDLRWMDAMLLWRHAFVEPEKDKGKRKSYSLEAAMKEFFPQHAGFKDFTDFQTTDPKELAKLLNRNRMDAAFTLKLADIFWTSLSARQRVVAILESACLTMVADTFNRGLCIDIKEAEALRGDLTAKSHEIYADLVTKHPEVAMVDLGSPKQLGDLLFTQWGLTSTKKTDKGANSTDKEALADLADHDPRANQLRQYREAVGNCTKYVDSPLKSCEYWGEAVTRPQAKVFGTYTGRMTYYSKQGKGKNELPTGIALHQWPRDKRYRNLIIPPEGYTLLEFDFAGQEFRWMAVASGDDTMLGLCAEGEDAHAYMGSMASGMDYRFIQNNAGVDAGAKNNRYMGKFANLSFQYRIGAPSATIKAKTQYGLILDESFVADLIRSYKQAYPLVPRYWDEQIYRCRHLGFAETLAGRRVQLQNIRGWEADSAAINYPIQGTGADQKYLGLAYVRSELATYGAYFYMELHDGLFFIVPHAKAEAMAHKFKNLLSNLPYRSAWNQVFPIQFPVDAKMSKESWGKLEEIK